MPNRPETSPDPVDRLSSLLERCRVRAQLFHQGQLCGVSPFPALPGRGFLHVMRSGRLVKRRAKNAASELR